MTNEIEKSFFDTFGIENKEIKTKECERCYHYEEAYDAPCHVCTASKCPYITRKKPQITDHILLELICIVLNTFETFEVYRIMDIDSLKEKILKLSMLAKDDVYSQVRTLFEEDKTNDR